MGTKNKIKKYGLVGESLIHSFSKSYFTKKFEKLELKYQYKNFEFKDEQELANFLLDNVFELQGFNVTIPYKETIIPYLDKLDLVSEQTQAVNTVLVKNGQLIGYNTDVIGFTKSISKLIKSNHKKALILGTGGASKAIAYALEDMGIETTFVSRNSEEKEILSYQGLDEKVLTSHLIIINTTPLGIFPNEDTFPKIPYRFITDSHLIFDLVYNPEETKFLKKAKEQGATTQNGLAMLSFQAEAAWKIWNK